MESYRAKVVSSTMMGLSTRATLKMAQSMAMVAIHSPTALTTRELSSKIRCRERAILYGAMGASTKVTGSTVRSTARGVCSIQMAASM